MGKNAQERRTYSKEFKAGTAVVEKKEKPISRIACPTVRQSMR